MKNFALVAAAAALLVAGCQSNNEAADSLNNNVPVETQQKVYRELRAAMTLAGKEALAAYPKTGIPRVGPRSSASFKTACVKRTGRRCATPTKWHPVMATPFGQRG